LESENKDQPGVAVRYCEEINQQRAQHAREARPGKVGWQQRLGRRKPRRGLIRHIFRRSSRRAESA
jgi:hypothetical protein